MLAPVTVSSFQAGRFVISVLCATLVHALILSAAGTWLGMGEEGSGGPTLMALELSGGGSNLGTRAGGQTGPSGAPSVPLGAAAAQPSVTEDASQAPPLPTSRTMSTSKTQDMKISPPAVPATKKPEPKALAKTSATPSPPSKALPEQIAPSSPGQEPAKADAHEATNGSEAQLPENSGQDSSEAGEGPSETAGTHPGVARQTQGAGSGPGASGNGAAGAGGGDGTAGSSGKGGNLIRFNSPGGPGIVRMTQPRYPYEARRLGKEGVVVLKLSLDETGSISDVEVLKGGDFGMAEASREAVMLSRFRPATVKGRPVACQAILPIHFKLR